MTDSPYAGSSPTLGTPWPSTQPMRGEAPTALGIITVVMAIGFTAVVVATSIAAWPAAEHYQEAIDAGGSSLDVFTWYDGLTLLIFPVAIASYVVACLWLQQARNNTDPAYHQRGKVWVWLSWWVPVVSLWFPYQVVRDVRDSSAARVGLGLWWTAWLVMLTGERIASSAATNDDFVGTLPTVELVDGVAAVVACVLWCRIVLRITNAQKEQLQAR